MVHGEVASFVLGSESAMDEGPPSSELLHGSESALDEGPPFREVSLFV